MIPRTVHPSPAMRRGLAALGAGAWVLTRVSTALAQPAGAPCTDERVVVAGELDAAWSAAMEAACVRLRDLPDRDPGARLFLAPDPAGRGVLLRLELADGRIASRNVGVPEELARVMEALVTLPPPSAEPAEPVEAAPTPSAPPPTVAPTKPPVAAAPPRVAEPGAAGTAEAAIPIAFDVAVLATSRILGPSAHVGVGLVASGDVDIDQGWIVGLRARADVATFDVEASGDLESVGFGGGLELARRIRIQDAAAIDLGLGADGLVEVPVEGGRGGRGGGRGGRGGDDASGDLRARTFAKIWISGGGLSFAGLLGFELSPVRVGGDGSRPAFGGELGAGIGWGAL